jgi:autotransporter-associated beta strand protein
LVKDGDLVLDGDGSIASSSGAIVEKSGGLTFAGRADVGSLAIQNHGRLFFRGDSHADSAFIASDGEIHFENAASGGKARIALEQGGTLDISGLDSGMTVGSIESKDGNGTVFLGSKNLAVGGNNLSTTFAGAIRDGGVLSFATRGSLTKEGKGALTLTGENTYTGATKVTDGALIVNGSISLSSGVTIESGGTLAGTGTVSSTAVNAGGTLLAGHGDAPFGAITVQGSLAFASGATYLVQVSPDNAGLTNVVASAAGQGTADLGGATVKAGFAKGSYVTKRYNILHADGGLNGTTFGNLANTNLAPFLVASLSYGVNDVFLDLKTVDPTTIPGLNVNQRNVARGIVNSINLVGGAPGAFATLTSPASLTQVSGETAVGSQQATFDAMGQFMGVMLDPTVGGRSAGDSPRNAMASASMPRKAPVAEDFSSRWAVWAAGFGGSQSTNGDAALGSNKTTSSVYGAAAGADYRLSPNTIVGFALAGGGTGFRVANGGSGNSDLFQAGTICATPRARPSSPRRWPMAGRTSPPTAPSPRPASTACVAASMPTHSRGGWKAAIGLRARSWT